MISTIFDRMSKFRFLSYIVLLISLLILTSIAPYSKKDVYGLVYLIVAGFFIYEGFFKVPRSQLKKRK